jgi:hypothetical protein
MRNLLSGLTLCCSVAGLLGVHAREASAGDLILHLGRSEAVTFVGAINRWDDEGNPRKPVDPKASIQAPRVTAQAVRQDGSRWVFKNLPPGRYDLVVLARGRVRVEGFDYPPLTEFDPFLSPKGKAPREASDWIVKDIAKARHYENKVAPLFLGGNDKQVRILVQLVRDQPTSYDAEYGAPVATVRHEIWQYTYQYGSWVKDRRTKILDRILLANKEFQRWTWVWEPRLGGIEVGKKSVEVTYELPRRFEPRNARGWFPRR